VTRTVSIDIYDQVQASNYVSRTKRVVLLAISFVVLSAVYALNRKDLGGVAWK